jgi:hypothetical protein
LTTIVTQAHARVMSTPKPRSPLFVGRYHVLRELGRGGMGTVHLAYQPELGREVALKRILPENVGLDSAEGWFKREYTALASLRHPGIPAIYDCGRSDDGVAYFTMEIIEGPSLASALKARKFEAVEAITIAIDLARILAVTHAVGVIHRDVKPTNIILEAGGLVRLIDFGICFLLPRFRGRPALRTVGEDEYRTGPMEVAGSPGYTDPALMNGHPPSVQSDIFSVSVILYEMLARRRLYDDKTGSFRQIDTGEFAPELAPVVTELQCGAQLLPRDRHASMDQFVRDLEIARSAVIRAQSAAPTSSGRGLLLAFSVINSIVLLAVLGFFAAGRPGLDGPVSPPIGSAVPTTQVRSPVEPAAIGSALAEPAAADLAPVELAAPKSAVAGPPADERPRLPLGPTSRVTPGTDESRVLSQALVSSLAMPALPALRACQHEPGPSNLQIAVKAGRARLVQVEWVAYDRKDPTHRCFLRALGTIDFPRQGPVGPYRLRFVK